MTSSRWWGGGQVKNGQNSDESGWLQWGRRGGEDPQKLDIHSHNQYKSYQSPDRVSDRCLVLL